MVTSFLKQTGRRFQHDAIQTLDMLLGNRLLTLIKSTV